MPLSLEPRPRTPRPLAWLAPVFAVLAAAALAGVAFAAMGYPPGATLHAFFVAPLLSADGWAELLLKAAPLVLVAEGLAFGFRGGVWNIGAEGQITLGAIAGGGMALLLHEQGGGWVLPLVCLAGLLGGMAWGAVPAWLRLRFGASEILVSLMLAYVAQLLLVALVHGPWKDPEGFNFPHSRMFSDGAVLPPLLEGQRPTWGTLLSFASAPLAWVLVSRSVLGFHARVAGLAPAAARFAGFREAGLVWAAMLIGGGCAGLAGVFEVAGPIGQLIAQVSPGYGFTAIIVAFLGRLHPFGIVPAGLLVALSYLGAESAQVAVGLPRGASGLVQGGLLFAVLAADVPVRFRLRRVRRAPEGATVEGTAVGETTAGDATPRRATVTPAVTPGVRP